MCPPWWITNNISLSWIKNDRGYKIELMLHKKKKEIAHDVRETIWSAFADQWSPPKISAMTISLHRIVLYFGKINCSYWIHLHLLP